MRYGIVTPVILLNPRVVNKWEHDAGIDELEQVVKTADRLGYHHLTASNHVAIPHAASERRGRRYWDPAVTLGYAAAVTERIRLATFCLVLGYHHPLEIVKRYGTLDRVSRGRMILGLGVGSLEEEFAMLDRPFADRGARADDAIRAIQASWGEREPSYDGRYWKFSGVTVDPTPVQESVPIWIGGQSERSLRRALQFGDAWVPFALEPEQVSDMLSAFGRPAAVGLAPEPPFDPVADPDGVRRSVDHHRECGATFLNLRFRSESLEHWIEQADAFTQLVGPSSEA